MQCLRKLHLGYKGFVAVIVTILVCVIQGIYEVISRDNIIQSLSSDVVNRFKGI